MSEKIEGNEKTMHTEAMEGVLKQAKEAAEEGKTSFEDAFISLLESDGYTGGMSPALKEALKKRDIQELIRIACLDGWL